MFATIILYAVAWIGFHLGAGYLVHRLSLPTLRRLPLLCTRLFLKQEMGLYRRLRVQRWKGRLPEAGAFFSGGFSKRRLTGHDDAYLERFILETSRAECAHWLTWALSLTFFIWTPWPVGLVMVGYGGVVNLPFILVQRYNRLRLIRVRQRYIAPNTGFTRADAPG